MGILDLEPSIPKQKMEEYIWVITGRNKVGKTTLANDFPKPYHFKFEPSTSGLLTHEFDVMKKSNELNKHAWVVFKAGVNEFIENDGYGFKTAIFDPFGVPYDLAKDYIKKKYNVDSPADIGDFGKGWGFVNDEVEGIIRKLLSNEFGVIFVAHMKTTTEKDGLGGEKNKIDLDVGGKAGKFLKNMTDIFLLADFDEEGQRKLFVRPTNHQEAGSRLDFNTDKIDLDFDELKEAFDEAIERNNEEQGVTQQMIDDYYKRQDKKPKKKELISKVKDAGIKPAESRKILKKKFGKEKVNELTIEEIDSYQGIIESEEYEELL